MKKAKSFVVSALMIVFVFNVFLPLSDAEARSSDYLMSHYAYLHAGDNSGELTVDFTVHAATNPTLLGVYKIKFYESDGTYVTTVWGTVINGLLSNDGSRYYRNTYTFDRAEPGTYYYALVTVMAKDNYGGDTYEIETNVVKAP